MPNVEIIHLDPQADERAFKDWEVQILKVGGSINLNGAFAVYYDRKTQTAKYVHNSRILQIDQELTPTNKLEAAKKESTSPKAVVFYHKVWREGDWIDPRIKNIGHKPYGFECVLKETNPLWTTVYTPSFAAKIIIPTNKIIGMNVEEQEKDA